MIPEEPAGGKNMPFIFLRNIILLFSSKSGKVNSAAQPALQPEVTTCQTVHK